MPFKFLGKKHSKMEEENNKYASQTPNLTSFLNSTNTELPFNSRSYMIHSIFAKKYNLTEKKIRSSSFSSQMKSLFIKNLILKPWTKQIISHELEKSSKKPANSKTTSLVKISILPTSEELNKKLTKIQAKTPIKQKAKRHKNTHTRQFSAFSTNFNLNSTHLERNFGLQSRTNTESRVNIVSEHPSPKKSTYNPSQISFSSFDSPTIIYKNKRNLSICKKPVHNTFLKIKENSKEIITPLLKNIPILQGDLSLSYLFLYFLAF